MGSRAYIAMINPDGTGQCIYLGHGCYPGDAGMLLLEHYSERDQIQELINGGTICTLGKGVDRTDFYHPNYDEDWEDCKPLPLRNGTGEFFSKLHLHGPEWLYAWTPDGWFAARVEQDMPEYFSQLRTMTPEQFQDWFDNNTEPAWIEWRARARLNQRPRPLARAVERYREWDEIQMALPRGEDLEWTWDGDWGIAPKG